MQFISQIEMMAVRGWGYRSDIAVDNVSLAPGTCWCYLFFSFILIILINLFVFSNLLHVDFSFTRIYQHFIVSCPFKRDGVPVFCYSIWGGRCLYLWAWVTYILFWFFFIYGVGRLELVLCSIVTHFEFRKRFRNGCHHQSIYCNICFSLLFFHI